jgi:hypothetical protein
MESNEEGGTKPTQASRRSGDMSVPPDPETVEGGAQVPWHVYDRHANLLHIASTLARIIRQDRVTAIGMDSQAEPAYPE